MTEMLHDQLREYYEVYKATDALYSLFAEKSGMSASMFWVLYTVCAWEGNCTQKDVCNACAMSKQTVNSALKRLESQGYLTLEAAPEDRRSKYLLLTEQGRQYRQEHLEPLFRTEEETFGHMSEADRAALLQGSRAYLSQFEPAVRRLLDEA